MAAYPKCPMCGATGQIGGTTTPCACVLTAAIMVYTSPKQNACRTCGGFGTVPYRRTYHADTVQVPCEDCQPKPPERKLLDDRNGHIDMRSSDD